MFSGYRSVALRASFRRSSTPEAHTDFFFLSFLFYESHLESRILLILIVFYHRDLGFVLDRHYVDPPLSRVTTIPTLRLPPQLTLWTSIITPFALPVCARVALNRNHFLKPHEITPNFDTHARR